MKADDMYILIEGKVNIYYIPFAESLLDAEHSNQEELKSKNLLIRTIKAGEAIANLNLYYDKPHRNMAICVTSCKFIQLNKYAYLKSLLISDKILAEQAFDFFRTVDLFAHWTDDQLTEIILQSSSESIICNSVVFYQNQKSTDFYIIKSGLYGVYQKKIDEWQTENQQQIPFLKGIKENDNDNTNSNNGEKKEEEYIPSRSDFISKKYNLNLLHEYGPLDHFGHNDIMDNKRRRYAVVCKSQEGGELIRIKSSIFIQQILSNPITAKILLAGKIQDQALMLNPKKRLHNFFDIPNKIDIEQCFNSTKYYRNMKNIDKNKNNNNNNNNNNNMIINKNTLYKSPQLSSLSFIDKSNDSHHRSFFSLNNINNNNSSNNNLNLTIHSKSNSQIIQPPTIKIKSRNLSLPKISCLPPTNSSSSSSLTQNNQNIYNYSKSKQQLQSKQLSQDSPISPIINISSSTQIPSLNYIDNIPSNIQSPLSFTKSPLRLNHIFTTQNLHSVYSQSSFQSFMQSQKDKEIMPLKQQQLQNRYRKSEQI